MMFTR